ncbi:3-hydroxy-acyl-CoA-dehydrogenase [Hysterangium stoloniferum]|nr:3-hydroxy-acyl-CoA-dehydrogenase [Hysterangium stoloniferum]
MKIADRTFIVSGGSSGLGLATVETLLASGAYVSILDLSAPPSSQDPSHTAFFQTDISKTADVARAVEGTVAWAEKTGALLGGVVNAAGVGTVGKVVDARGDPLSLGLFEFTLAVNVVGTFDLTRLACKHLIHVPPEGEDGERGVIIMVSSAAAFEAQPGQAAYAASKGAVSSMTLPMARDLGRYGIRVNTVAPGTFESAMTARMPEKTRRSLDRETVFPRRFGNPPEFGETVKWMIECPFVNGETVRLSGAGRLPGKL